ncbi:BRI1 kinase inhibitor 1-like [Nymphaea colorata]|uniref:BRI1 kinase inhibitor 1-like n=1 Tax=Nymphaea colorata TaxID=210225 RepID=UPI00129E47F8|nr:BRI1 kinase inhibitor 1-like [Nymphaea colorata]
MEVLKGKENEQEEEKRRPTFPAKESNSPFSSPTHDFEFSITLPLDSYRKPSPTTQPSYEIDLCPADDLFFQGHLLPLHHHHHHHHDHDDRNHQGNEPAEDQEKRISVEEKPRSSSNQNASSTKSKPRSFSFITLKKGSKLGLKAAKEVIEKYVKLVKPFFTWGADSKSEEQKKASSGRQRWNCRDHSARSFTKRRPSRSSGPCSSAIRSPVNSGVLCSVPPPQKSESTMEDLQNAIQAAIAHCKNSNAAPKQVHQP